MLAAGDLGDYSRSAAALAVLDAVARLQNAPGQTSAVAATSQAWGRGGGCTVLR